MRHQRVGWELSAAIAALGCTSLVTQTILLREFMSIFAGNELVIGMVLANWMILTGTGAILGRLLDRTGVNPGVTVSLLLLTGTLPIVTVFLVRSLRNLVFPAGALIGMWESAYSSFILLIPYCLVSGCLFTMMARMISDRQEENKIAWVYSVEAIGSIAGGLAFNLVAVAFLTTFQSLIFVAMLDLAVCATLAKQSGGRPAMSGILAFGAVILIVSLTVNLDQVTRERMFDGQSLLYHTDTPYGSLVVTKQGDQTNFFENSALLFSSGDVTTNEEAIHYAMVQHPTVVMPYTTAQKKLKGTSWLDDIVCSAVSAEAINPAIQQISELLRDRHHIRRGQDDDFNIRRPDEFINAQLEARRTFSLLLISIASVSLLVGGIGIMDVMLVSVTERTREIGVRMSIGATDGDVAKQFLGEAVMLSLFGGLLGVAFGIAASYLVGRALQWPMEIPPQAIAIAALFAVAVGVFFGFYPARKASKLDPIEALRFE